SFPGARRAPAASPFRARNARRERAIGDLRCRKGAAAYAAGTHIASPLSGPPGGARQTAGPRRPTGAPPDRKTTPTAASTATERLANCRQLTLWERIAARLRALLSDDSDQALVRARATGETLVAVLRLVLIAVFVVFTLFALSPTSRAVEIAVCA